MFDTDSMASALPNGHDDTHTNGTNAGAVLRAAQQAGWVEHDAYNYDDCTASTGGTLDGKHGL